MNAINTQIEASFEPMVTIPEKEYIELKAAVGFWKYQHESALKRLNEAKKEIAKFKAKVRDLTQRVFGKKTEKGKKKGEQGNKKPKSSRPRGQQKGKKGHGRKVLNNLPVEEIIIDVPDPCCPVCGKEGDEMPTTDDCDIIEVEVKAHIRRHRRKKVRLKCNCEGRPEFTTAPPPNRLIPKGKHGISVWTTIILDKFFYGNPTNRLLEIWKDHGLTLSQGTITGGLKKIAPLFDPIADAIRDHSLQESHWHADETRWSVFAEVEGKIGTRWYLWVFRSPEAVVFVLDPTRSTEVLRQFFKELIEEAGDDEEKRTIICDRYSAYKCLAKEIPWILLAFCWAHQRRDFLELARKWPKSEKWALDWVEEIGKLYHLNNLRLEVREDPVEFEKRDQKLRICLDEMSEKRDQELEDKKVSKNWKSPLESMKNHWDGLTIFVDHPEIPMDNNRGENAIRPPIIGRKNFFGSGSIWSAMFTAVLYTILMTIKYWEINPRLWLDEFLQACAEAGNRCPEDLSPFLPWMMDEQRLAHFRKPQAIDDS